MAKVTITIIDTDDGGVEVTAEADPGFPIHDESRATLAHMIGLSLLEGAKQAGCDAAGYIDLPNVNGELN